MTQKGNVPIMPIFGRLSLIAIATFAAMFLGFSAAQTHAQKVELPGGFRLGSSLEEAQLHATSHGWKLDQLSPQFPWVWMVKERDISLHFCNESLGSGLIANK
ncbi:hypothetical protein O4J55_24820 [Paracoccus sp. PXZ]